MKDQGTAKLSESVRAAVINAFSTEFRFGAMDTLLKYGVDKDERESERVQLAIVDLSDGIMSKLVDLVAEAKKDYRNILYWNEEIGK